MPSIEEINEGDTQLPPDSKGKAVDRSEMSNVADQSNSSGGSTVRQTAGQSVPPGSTPDNLGVRSLASSPHLSSSLGPEVSANPGSSQIHTTPPSIVNREAFRQEPFTPARRRYLHPYEAGASLDDDAPSSTPLPILTPDSVPDLRTLIEALIVDAVSVVVTEQQAIVQKKLSNHVPYLLDAQLKANLGFQEQHVGMDRVKPKVQGGIPRDSFFYASGETGRLETLFMRLQTVMDEVYAFSPIASNKARFRHQPDYKSLVRGTLRDSASADMLRTAYDALCGRLRRAVFQWLQRVAVFIFLNTGESIPDDVSVVSSTQTYWDHLGRHIEEPEALLASYVVQATRDGFLRPSPRYDASLRYLDHLGVELPPPTRPARAIEEVPVGLAKIIRGSRIMLRPVTPPPVEVVVEQEAGPSATLDETENPFRESPTIVRHDSTAPLRETDPYRRDTTARLLFTNNPVAERMMEPSIGMLRPPRDFVAPAGVGVTVNTGAPATHAQETRSAVPTTEVRSTTYVQTQTNGQPARNPPERDQYWIGAGADGNGNAAPPPPPPPRGSGNNPNPGGDDGDDDPGRRNGGGGGGWPNNNGAGNPLPNDGNGNANRPTAPINTRGLGNGGNGGDGPPPPPSPGGSSNHEPRNDIPWQGGFYLTPSVRYPWGSKPPPNFPHVNFAIKPQEIPAFYGVGPGVISYLDTIDRIVSMGGSLIWDMGTGVAGKFAGPAFIRWEALPDEDRYKALLKGWISLRQYILDSIVGPSTLR